MDRLLWVASPLIVFGAWALVRWAIGKPLRRHAFNVFESLLLLAYFAITVGLGVFWVANQQLPVFDWHYLFGYATTLLVLVHLVVNWRVVTAYFRRRPTSPEAGRQTTAKQPPPRMRVAPILGAAALLLAGFYIGTRYGTQNLPPTLAPIAVPRLPGDSQTTATQAAPDQSVALVEQYHEYSSHDRAGLFTRAPGVDWGPPPEPFKTYPARPSINLPPPRSDADSSYSVSAALHGHCPPAVPQNLKLHDLADILHYAVGITSTAGGIALRASPSSGALFPSELYVLAQSVEGLQPGLYHYNPDGHRLVSLLLPQGADTTFGKEDANLQHAPAIVFLASIFRRTGYKYRDRAYRYAAADGGHALENLMTAATAVGLETSALKQFDDASANRLVGLDTRDEGVLAVVPIWGPCRERRPQPSTREAINAAAQEEMTTTSIGVTGIVQTATSLDLAPRPLLPNAPGATTTTAQLPPSTAIQLPPPVAAPAPPLATMAARRSIRRFTDQPLTQPELSSLLHYVARAPAKLSETVRVHIVAHAVEGLPPGSYRYAPDTHTLVATSLGERRSDAAAAALNQDVIGSAAVVFILSLDRKFMFANDGARGYRNGFLEAGMMGERIYLEAVARKLGACAVGAFFDHEAADLIGVSMEDQWVVHFCGVGRPAGTW